MAESLLLLEEGAMCSCRTTRAEAGRGEGKGVQLASQRALLSENVLEFCGDGNKVMV